MNELLLIIGGVIFAAVVALMRVYRFGPYLEDEEMKEVLVPESELDDPVEAIPEPQIAPVEPVPAPQYRWDTPQAAFHSVRVICDEMGLPLKPTVLVDGKLYLAKDVVCATIFGESEFNINAKNHNGKSTDHSLCQYNDGPPGVPPEKKWYIGPGKLFKNVEDVYANPERQVRYMVNYWKANKHLNPWYAYKNGPYKKFLPRTSRMWKLRTVDNAPTGNVA